MWIKYFLFLIFAQNCHALSYQPSSRGSTCNAKCREEVARFVENYPWVIVLAVVVPLLACICCVVCVRLKDGSRVSANARTGTQQTPGWKGYQGHQENISYVNSPEVIIVPNGYFSTQTISSYTKNDSNGMDKLHQMKNPGDNANKGYLISLEETKMSTEQLKDFAVGKITNVGIPDNHLPHHQLKSLQVNGATVT